VYDWVYDGAAMPTNRSRLSPCLESHSGSNQSAAHINSLGDCDLIFLLLFSRFEYTFQVYVQSMAVFMWITVIMLRRSYVANSGSLKVGLMVDRGNSVSANGHTGSRVS
jgi:hypothetical protein